MNFNGYRFLLVGLLILFVWNCKKDDGPTEKPPIVIKEATDANKFVYNGLAAWYLWVDYVPNLVDPKFDTKDSLNAFLNKYTDPSKLFYDLLYKYGTIDKWSFIVDNSKTIDEWLSGVSESMGFDFGLGYINQQVDNRIVGYVRYVLKGSPADKAGIKRGDLFLSVDGQQLTASNYQTLLYSKTSYTLGMASYSNGAFIQNGKNLAMTAVVIHENPVFMDSVMIVNGLKIGYLVYNSFTSAYDSIAKINYDIELNKVFGRFKAAGIQKLILDLRYNPGGAITSTIYLASMIYSVDTKKVFSRTQHNNAAQAYLKQTYGDDYFIDYFADKIEKTKELPETPINSLGLNELYVITTSNTASASELLINSLKPYITVKQVGTNTSGKYVGSYTLKDYIDSKGTLNPNHKYAMQPITLKIANSQGITDYVNGLDPTITAREYAVEYLPFGNQNEVLLKACLDDIKGTKSAVRYTGPEIKEVKTAKQKSPYYQLMYYDSEKIRSLIRNKQAE